MFECKTMKMLIHDHVTCKLDYYNSLHYVLPYKVPNKDLLKKLQLNMKIAARLLKGLLPHKRIIPAIKYWIPIKAQIHQVFIICEGYPLQKKLALCEFACIELIISFITGGYVPRPVLKPSTYLYLIQLRFTVIKHENNIKAN